MVTRGWFFNAANFGLGENRLGLLLEHGTHQDRHVDIAVVDALPGGKLFGIFLVDQRNRSRIDIRTGECHGFGPGHVQRGTASKDIVAVRNNAVDQCGPLRGDKFNFDTHVCGQLVHGINVIAHQAVGAGVFEGHGVEITGGAHPQGSALQNLGEF